MLLDATAADREQCGNYDGSPLRSSSPRLSPAVSLQTFGSIRHRSLYISGAFPDSCLKGPSHAGRARSGHRSLPGGSLSSNALGDWNHRAADRHPVAGLNKAKARRLGHVPEHMSRSAMRDDVLQRETRDTCPPGVRIDGPWPDDFVNCSDAAYTPPGGAAGLGVLNDSSRPNTSTSATKAGQARSLPLDIPQRPPPRLAAIRRSDPYSYSMNDEWTVGHMHVRRLRRNVVNTLNAPRKN